MGILANAGILENGKLSDESWYSYVNDVKNTLTDGKGPLPFSFPCDVDLKPVPGAKMLDLANELAFPDFTRIWRNRYEQMVLSLDVEGDKPFAPTIFDPTSVLGDLGITLSGKPSLSDVVTQITGLLASQGKTELLIPAMAALYASEEGSENLIAAAAGLAVQPPISAPAEALIKIIAPPPLPTPPLPDINVPLPNIEQYIDQFKYEIALGLAPQKVHIEIMKSLANPLEIPNILSGLPASIIEIACKAAGQAKPKPEESGAMDTSVVEKAAERTLIQHQVRLQSLIALGTTLGDGMLTKTLASTPIDSGGMGLVEEKKEEPAPNKFVGNVPNGTCPPENVNKHKRGRKIILEVSEIIFPKRKLNPIELQIVQLVGWLESRYGLSNPPKIPKSVGLINNWGGVQCGVKKPAGTTCQPSEDKQADGKVYSVPFVKYPTQEQGCADMMRHVMQYRPQTGYLLKQPPAENDSPGEDSNSVTLFRIAYTLRREKYYEGFCNTAAKQYNVGGSLTSPDKNVGTKACAKEAISLWVTAQLKNLNEMLAPNCLNEPIAFPVGTYEDAEKWYKKKNNIFI
jgi:hypothetical protein